MPNGVGIVVKGVRNLMARFSRLERAIGNTTEVHRRLGITFVAWGQRNFRAGGLERKWAPIKPSTLLARRQKSKLPLRDSGKLQASFLNFRATRFEMRWGSPSFLAEIHHGGTGPYTIRPKKKKVLAFVAAGGKQVSKGSASRIFAAEKQGQFTGFRLGGRSKRDFRNLPFVFAREVKHPGLPARPLLPSPALANQMASRVVQSYVREKLKEQQLGQN